MPRTHADTRAHDGRAAITAACESMLGPALVLDAGLRIVLSTPGVEALLGFVPDVGALAPSVLCGTRPERPVALALARGESVEAILPSPRADSMRYIRARAVPTMLLRKRVGFVVLLEDASSVEHDGAAELHGFVTRDEATKEVLRIVERVAREPATVLVRGETGTGKDVLARALHALSPRSRGPFRALNCAALPATLLESELFGHARGAFTGAIRDVKGHVELAHGGTLFLDEVGELPLELQAKLLRMLETRTVLPVGAREPIPVDVRIVSATHRSLRAEVEAGRFRSDLMYRLRVVPIHIPPLRERPGDVRLLTERIVAELSLRGNRRVSRVSAEAMARLESHDFPGNVRELRNILEYAFAVGDGPVLLPFDLPRDLEAPVEPAVIVRPHGSEPSTSDAALDADDRRELRRIEAALERAAGRRDRAASILGISRVTLWRKMRALGLAGA